jgi:hypothetical protein
MKNLLLTLFVLFSFGFSFAQNAVVKGNESTLSAQVEKGVIEIIMPASASAEKVNSSAEYYVDYFSVNYNADSRVAKISMKENTPDARRVINRLLLSNGVRIIEFSGQEYSINKFYEEFLSH